MSCARIHAICFGVLFCTFSLASVFGAQMPYRISDQAMKSILTAEKITNVWHIEQTPQQASSDDDVQVRLFVLSNLRELEHEVCLADLHVLGLRERSSGWVAIDRESRSQVTGIACSAAQPENFADLDDKVSERTVVASIELARQLFAKSLPSSVKVEFQSPILEKVVTEGALKGLVSISALSDDRVELEFAIKGLMPRLFGLRLTFKNGSPMKVYVNSENEIDPAF